MKICILAHSLNPRTGAGVFSSNIIGGIEKKRPDIRFSILTKEDYLKPSIFHIVKNWFAIRKEIKKADLVHSLDGYPYGIIACLAAFGTGRPVIITAVGSGSIKQLRNSVWKAHLLKWAYLRAARVTAISRYVARELHKKLPDLLVEVIHPGVDHVFYGSGNSSISPSSDYPSIITQGEFKRRKGYSELLPIMQQVMNVRENVRYTIVADANLNKPYRDELYLLMEQLGIRHKVTVVSGLTREALREKYQRSTLYLSLPKDVDGDVEGFGMSIMEAAAAGVPAIVGRGSGADDTVLEGKSGFLVDGTNQKEVMEKILLLLDDKKLHAELSVGAKKWAQSNGWEKKLEQYIDLYESIVYR